MTSPSIDSSLYQRPSELLQRLVRFDTTNPPGDEAECIAGADGIVIEAGSRATLDGNTLLGGGPISIVDASEPLIEDNALTGGSAIWGIAGDEAIVRGNTISGASDDAIHMGGPGGGTIERNVITDTPVGVVIGSDDELNSSLTVRDNLVSGARIGINVIASGGTPAIQGNELSGNATGILIARADATISGNYVHDNGSGISVDRGSPNLEGNTIEDNKVGVAILMPAAKPTLSGNRLCGNETNFRLMRNVEMPATDGNDICPDAVAAVSE